MRSRLVAFTLSLIAAYSAVGCCATKPCGRPAAVSAYPATGCPDGSCGVGAPVAAVPAAPVPVQAYSPPQDDRRLAVQPA